jgi:DNA-binding NtrC family response regulator
MLAEEPEANIARHFLERKGCRVTIVSDGHQGLELARLEHPDVVVLDVLTSGMDGFKVYNVMKADAQLSQIPLVFIDRGRLSPWPGAHQSPDVISFPDPQGLARAIEYVISHKSEAPTLAPNTQPSDAEHQCDM